MQPNANPYNLYPNIEDYDLVALRDQTYDDTAIEGFDSGSQGRQVMMDDQEFRDMVERRRRRQPQLQNSPTFCATLSKNADSTS